MSQVLGMALLTAIGVFLVLFTGSLWLLDAAFRRGRVDVAERLERRSNGNGNGHSVHRA